MSLEERGWTKQILRPGNGVKPRKGDTVSLAYTGWIKDLSNTNDHCKGKQFDTSRQRGPFQTIIGVGAVIQGWDKGVLDMSLHEKSILTIDSRFAYGQRGFPALIPGNSDLVLEVELLGIGTP